MKHVRDLVGIEHVALGSDFDGAVTTSVRHRAARPGDPGAARRGLHAGRDPRGDGRQRAARDPRGHRAACAAASRAPMTRLRAMTATATGARAPARRDRRARQFRRLPSRPPGGRRARRSRWARAEGRPAIVATFDPHPVRHFTPDVAAVPPDHARPARRSCSPRPGADAMLVFHFDAALAATTAEDFVARAAGRAHRRGGRGDRRGLHLRQGPRRQCRAAAPSWAREHGIAARAVGAGRCDGGARGLLEPHPRRAARPATARPRRGC